MKKTFILLCFMMLTTLNAVGQATDPWPIFKDKLEAAVNSRGGLAQNSYQFCILYNTAVTANSGPKFMFDIFNGLASNYLVSTDNVSFVPFQLEVRKEAVWNQPFKPDAVDQLIKLVPNSPLISPGLKGGNDIERALLTAVQNCGSPDKTIFIVLTYTPNSQDPEPAAGFQRVVKTPGWDKPLLDNGVEIVSQGVVEGKALNADRELVDAQAYFRIYTAKKLTPLAAIAGGSRRLQVIHDKQNRESAIAHSAASDHQAELDAAKAKADQIAAKAKSENDAKLRKQEDAESAAKARSMAVSAVVILVVVVISVAAGLAINRRMKPRDLQVVIGQIATTGSVKYGKRTVIGGQGCDLVIAGVPTGERVAFVENRGMQVIIRGLDSYRLGIANKPEVITTAAKTLVLTNTQSPAGSLSASVKLME